MECFILFRRAETSLLRGEQILTMLCEYTVLRHMTYLSSGKRCFRNNSHYKRNICGSTGGSRMTLENCFVTKATAVLLNRGNV